MKVLLMAVVMMKKAKAFITARSTVLSLILSLTAGIIAAVIFPQTDAMPLAGGNGQTGVPNQGLSFVEFLGLDHVFSTWWFVALSVLFVVTLAPGAGAAAGAGDADGAATGAGAAVAAGAAAGPLSAVLSAAGLPASGLAAAGAACGLRKSVTYQPEPLSWKPAAVTCFSKRGWPQAGQSASGGSDILRSTSLVWPQAAQR